MSTCAQAARTYAEELETAQEEARQAIADARDAQRRIDQREADLEDALGAQIRRAPTSRSGEHADHSRSACPTRARSPTATPPPRRSTSAQAAETDARRRLEQAQDDLDRAKRRGEQAEQDAATPPRRRRARSRASPATRRPPPCSAAPRRGREPVLARVRAGDYSVLDEVAYQLPARGHPAARSRPRSPTGASRPSYGEGDHSIAGHGGTSSAIQHDDEFATGFYNELGGGGRPTSLANSSSSSTARAKGWTTRRWWR